MFKLACSKKRMGFFLTDITVKRDQVISYGQFSNDTWRRFFAFTAHHNGIPLYTKLFTKQLQH